jgi:tRNA(Ile)-lysidine synthase
MALSLTDIATSLRGFSSETDIAVALSGGGDSMALTHILSEWCTQHKIKLHILHVDHGLRTESAREAKQIKSWVADIPHHKFSILKWKHTGAISKKIQEQAREARYKLLSAYCKKQNIKYLFIAHHGDDQAETILFRLAKSSGIDGLSAMQLTQAYDKNLTFIRPLLTTTHDDLISYCRRHKLNWIEDPSNNANKFARVRLRQSKGILSAEGLTNDRLRLFGVRCTRAKNALQFYTDQIFTKNVIKQTKNYIEFVWQDIAIAPDEIKIRIIQKSIHTLYPTRAYPAPLERIEDIIAMMSQKLTSKATLANCLITWSKGKNRLIISKE